MRVPLTEVAYMNLIMEMKNYWFANTDSPPHLSVLFPAYVFIYVLLKM